LVRLKRLQGDTSNTILVKLEGNNPAGSVKDRPAYNMIVQAELRGTIKPGDTLIEATSGNTGIALAMVAAIRGYKMILIMPDSMSAERKASMAAYGAQLILVNEKQRKEGARDLAGKIAAHVVAQHAADDVDHLVAGALPQPCRERVALLVQERGQGGLALEVDAGEQARTAVRRQVDPLLLLSLIVLSLGLWTLALIGLLSLLR
jgi:threonine dehydratase